MLKRLKNISPWISPILTTIVLVSILYHERKAQIRYDEMPPGLRELVDLFVYDSDVKLVLQLLCFIATLVGALYSWKKVNLRFNLASTILASFLLLFYFTLTS